MSGEFTPTASAPGRQRSASPSERLGMVSYRLARQQAIEAYERGQRTQTEVCDAQPELRRVAHSFGRPLNESCPICEEDHLVSVTFAFGSGLPRSGRVLGTLADVRTIQTRGKPASCYQIEVCRSCWWNHLSESYEVAGH